MKIKLSTAETYLAEHMDDLNCRNTYLKNIDFSRQAIQDIDPITEFLIELVTNNGPDSEGYHTIEGLGLPVSELINDDNRINDEEEEGDY